ncbi:MAG: hypothetical protein PHI23_04585 [Candidatus Peribacteraceae bacterium]|nr:hypothetical protein [Candidatus Peribacteraceae bacterium]
MAEIRPPVVIAYRIFRIEDIQKLSKIFLEAATENNLDKSFKVQFADDHVAQVTDNILIYQETRIIDREFENIEMTIGNAEQNNYSKLVLNHGNKDASYIECSAKNSTWAAGFESSILTQINQSERQLGGRYQGAIGFVVGLMIWGLITYALGNFLHMSGLTERFYNLIFSHAAFRIIPNSYALPSYFLAVFPSGYFSDYLLRKLNVIFPVVELRIGKKYERRHARLKSIGNLIAQIAALPLLSYLYKLGISLYQSWGSTPPN